MEQEYIIVEGARVHNLKNVDVKIPRKALTVITGLSGSGKSSLAFDTIYAEGQRRYIETFSAYARNFLGNLTRPDVDKISGLSPVISIEQESALHGGNHYGDIRLLPSALRKGRRGIFVCHGRKDGALHGGADNGADTDEVCGP